MSTFINRNNFPKPTHFNYEQVQEQFVNASEIRDIGLDLSSEISDTSKRISNLVGLDFGNAPTDVIYNVGEKTFKRINAVTGESMVDSSVNDKLFSLNGSSAMILNSDDSDKNSEVSLTGVSNDLCLNIELSDLDLYSQFYNPYHEYALSSVIMSFYKNGNLYNIHRGCYITIYNTISKSSTVHNMNSYEKYTDKIDDKSVTVYDEFNTSKVITNLDVDSDGNVLFSTTNGLYYFNMNSLSSSEIAIISSNKTVIHIKCVNNSFIFITTDLAGGFSVSKITNNIQTVYNIENMVGKPPINKISSIGNIPVVIGGDHYAILDSQNVNLIDFGYRINNVFGSSINNYFVGFSDDSIFAGSVVNIVSNVPKYDISYTDTIVGLKEINSNGVHISYNSESIHILGYNSSKIERSARKNIVANRDSGKSIANITLINNVITIAFSDSTSEFMDFDKFVELFTTKGLCINTNTKVMNKLQTKTDMGNIFIFTNNKIVRIPEGNFSQIEISDNVLSDDLETFINVHVFDTGTDYKACILSEFKVGSIRYARANFISKVGTIITSMDRTVGSIQIPAQFSNFFGSKYYVNTNSVKFFVMDNGAVKSYLCNFVNDSIVISDDSNFPIQTTLFQKNSKILYGSNKFVKVGNISVVINDRFTKLYNGEDEILALVTNLEHQYIKNIEVYNDVAYISTSKSTIVINLVDIIDNDNNKLGYSTIDTKYKSSFNNDIIAIYDSKTLTVRDIENDIVYHDILNRISTNIQSFRLDFVERSEDDIYIGLHSIDSVKITAIYILRISNGGITFEKIDINDEFDLLSTNPRSIPNKTSHKIDNIIIYNRGIVYKFLLIDSVMTEKLKPILTIANNSKFIKFTISESEIRILTTEIDVPININLVSGVPSYTADKSCVDSLTIGNDIYTIRRFSNSITIYKNNVIVKTISPVVAGSGKIDMTNKGNVIIYKTSTYVVVFNMVSLTVDFSMPEYNYSNNVRHNEQSLFISKTCGTIIGNSNGGLYNELEFTTIRALGDVIYTEDSKCIEYKINMYNLLRSTEVFTASKKHTSVVRYKFLTIPKMISVKYNENDNHIILTDKVMFETTGSSVIIYGTIPGLDFDLVDNIQLYYTKETSNKLGYCEMVVYDVSTNSLKTISYSESRYSVKVLKIQSDMIWLLLIDHVNPENCGIRQYSTTTSGTVVVRLFGKFVKDCVMFSYPSKFMVMTDDSISILDTSTGESVIIVDSSNIQGIDLDCAFVRFEKMTRSYIDIIISKGGVEYLLPKCKFVEEIDTTTGNDTFHILVSEDIIESSVVRNYYSDELFGICIGASIENNINSIDAVQYDVMIGRFNQNTTILDIDNKNIKLGLKVPKNVTQPIHFHSDEFNVVQVSDEITIYDSSLSQVYKISDLNIFWILKDVKISGSYVLFIFENGVIASIYLGKTMYGKTDSGLVNCTKYITGEVFDDAFITDIGVVYTFANDIVYRYDIISRSFLELKDDIRFVKCDSLNSRLYIVTNKNEFGFIDCGDNSYIPVKNFDGVNIILGIDVSNFNSISIVCKHGLYYYTNDNIHHLYKFEIEDTAGENYKALVYPYKVK